jgi:hypothetical protein
LIGAVPGTLVFVVLGYLYSHQVFAQTWFYIGVGTVISAVFLEPYFASPQSAVGNGVATMAAVVASTRSPVNLLWWILFGIAGTLAASGAFAAAASESSRAKQHAFQLASRGGRALVLGAAALVLSVLTAGESRTPRVELFALAVAALLASIAGDWPRIWLRSVRQVETATVVAAVGPRMLLVAAPSHDLKIGEVLEVKRGIATARASVVARMPHTTGLRYSLALNQEWTAVCSGFPAEVTIGREAEDATLVGAAASGTTEKRIEFEPFSTIEIGGPLKVESPDGPLLYQVTSLELVNAEWAGSRAVVGRARARLVGRPTDNRITGLTHLPPAHDLIHDASDVAGGLEAGYYEVGKMKGTDVSIGLRADAPRRGHIAILGMSGMGKTVAATRLAAAFGATSPVVALDTTGEYIPRLGFKKWVLNDFASMGAFAYEPAGDPPEKAKELISAFMTAGSNEFKVGSEPTPRVVLLEEAHVFVPEWQFATKAQQGHVNRTAQLVMQARKFGLTFVVVSQRTAVVSKSVISQCENYIVLKTLDQTGLEYLETLVGRELRDALPKLERFEALCVGPAFNSDEPVIVSLTP